MGFVAAVGIAEAAMDDFLNDEVPAWMAGKLGAFEDSAEVADIAMKVTGDEDVVNILEADESPLPAGGFAKRLGCLTQRVKESDGIGHVLRGIGWRIVKFQRATSSIIGRRFENRNREVGLTIAT
jgi:hypothetical protein